MLIWSTSIAIRQQTARPSIFLIVYSKQINFLYVKAESSSPDSQQYFPNLLCKAKIWLFKILKFKNARLKLLNHCGYNWKANQEWWSTSLTCSNKISVLSKLDTKTNMAIKKIDALYYTNTDIRPVFKSRISKKTKQ